MKPIQTARLELIAANLAIVTADLHRRDELPALLNAQIASGWPPPLVDVPAMTRLKESFTDAGTNGWTAWYVIKADVRLLIGMGGFKGPPRDGSVELGYSLLAGFHGCGYGAELVGVLTSWAFQHRGVRCVFAETLPELAASQRVLEKNGFARAPQSSEPGVLRFERQRKV